MRGVAAIANQELADRRHWLVVALALGMVPILIMPLERALEPPVAISFLAFQLLLRASWLGAVVLGMSLIGRPLHAGQLAFYFRAPISGTAIAIGKLAGAVLLLLAVQLLVIAPAGLGFGLDYHESYLGRGYDFGSIGLLEVASPLAFLGFGLIAGVLARSRSKWFALDAAGLTLAVLLVIRILDRLTTLGERYLIHWNGRWQRPWELPEAKPPTDAQVTAWLVDEERFRDGVSQLWYGLAIAATVAVFVSMIAAVAAGRTDGRRAHAALSATLWASVAAIGSAGLAVAQWGVS